MGRIVRAGDGWSWGSQGDAGLVGLRGRPEAAPPSVRTGEGGWQVRGGVGHTQAL